MMTYYLLSGVILGIGICFMLFVLLMFFSARREMAQEEAERAELRTHLRSLLTRTHAAAVAICGEDAVPPLDDPVDDLSPAWGQAVGDLLEGKDA